MRITLKSFGLDKLNIDERTFLLHELQESIDQELKHRPPLSEAKKRELEARIADMEANPDDGIPWEVVKAETLKKLNSVK